MGSTTKRLCDALLNADDIDSYFDNNADRIDIGVDLSEFLEEKLKESGLTPVSYTHLTLPTKLEV